MQCVRGAQWKNMKEKQVKCTVTVCFTHLLAEDTMQLLRAYESLRMLKSHSFLLPPDRQTQTCVICVCVFDQCPIIYVEWLRRRFVSGVEISSLSLACLFRYFFFLFVVSAPSSPLIIHTLYRISFPLILFRSHVEIGRQRATLNVRAIASCTHHNNLLLYVSTYLICKMFNKKTMRSASPLNTLRVFIKYIECYIIRVYDMQCYGREETRNIHLLYFTFSSRQKI